MKKIILLVLLISSFKTIAQNTKKIILIDEDTKKVIPFANIVFNSKDYKGTSTDIDGVFYVTSKIENITISYIGYETRVLKVSNIKTQFIKLKQKTSELDEVVINNSENRAHRIIRNAVSNKDINNPENLKSFTYKSYDKIIVTSGKQKKRKRFFNGSYRKSNERVLFFHYRNHCQTQIFKTEIF